MREITRRRFMRYGIVSALAALGVGSAYLLTRRPASPSNGSRLPPGQHEIDSLLVLSAGDVPTIALEDWSFQVYGEVQNPVTLNWNRFLDLPKTVSLSDFDCVTGWTKLDNRWEGVKFKEILTLAKPTDRAKYATIECYGATYTTSLPLEDLLRDDVLFAYGLDGKQLPPEHGSPLRLVVPEKYGYKSAKWVKAVKFTEKQELGYWESYGYSNTADPWTNDRYG